MTSASVGILVQGASVSYRRLFRPRRVLTDIDFTAQPGEVTAIVGPNGAGKTTLFRTFLGFLTPDAGRCLIGGIPAGEYREQFGIAYQPESIQFPNPWNARDLLGRGVDLSHLPANKRDDAYRRAVARSRFDSTTLSRTARRYSRGMKRRLSLAYALIAEPAVVLLDEPFSGLDPPSRLALRQEILDARQRGATVVLASHELAEVERLANRAFILENGRIRPGPDLTPADAPSATALESEFIGNAH